MQTRTDLYFTGDKEELLNLMSGDCAVQMRALADYSENICRVANLNEAIEYYCDIDDGPFSRIDEAPVVHILAYNMNGNTVFAPRLIDVLRDVREINDLSREEIREQQAEQRFELDRDDDLLGM